MITNIGKTDTLLRLIAVITIAILYSTKVVTGTLGTVLMVLAGILLLTSFVRFCPLYLPFGIRTNKNKGKEGESCCTR